jgi:nucleoside-diphosphate-sugar epimerase
MKKACLISGQSGFIGRALTKKLEQDYIVIDIPRRLLKSTDELINLFTQYKPAYIFHLGAYGNHYHQKDILETIETNIVGTYRMLMAAQMINYELFFNFSSSSVLLAHKTLYSTSKLFCETMSSQFRNVKNIRPYSVYGPGEADHRFIPTVIRSLHSGEQMMLDTKATHDWIYIDDFITALLTGQSDIGSGIKTTNIEIVKALEKISGKNLNYKESRIRDYDNDNWVCAKGVPHISLIEGLRKTYEYYSK